MSKPEQNAWDALRPVLLGCGLDPKRVENVISPGHPDVDYTHGNIELKALEAFPIRPTTKVAVPEFSGEQAGWLANRWQSGGLSWLMVRVGRAWYLFDGWTALQVYRGLTVGQWKELAAFIYPGEWSRGRGWGSSPEGEGRHCYSRQLANWLRWDTERMEPEARDRARLMEGTRKRRD